MPRGGDRHPTDDRNEAEWLSSKGNGRCVHIRRNGKRCRKWAMKGYTRCKKHGAQTLHAGQSMYRFKTERASEVFERIATDPDYLSIQGELSVIRTCLQLFIDMRSDKVLQNGGQLKEGDIALMAQLAKDAATVAEACNRVERGLRLHISVESLDAFLGQMLQVLTEEVGDVTVVERIHERVMLLELPTGGPRPLADFPEGSPEREQHDKTVAHTGGESHHVEEADNDADASG